MIVIGGGLTGAAFAKTQGEAGRRVLVLERDLSQVDRIVGELLQPGGVRALRRLGLGAAVEGIGAVSVAGYALFRDRRVALLPYPVVEDAETGPEGELLEGPATGRSFHNGRFVQRVRQIAASTPNVVFRKGTARAVLGAGGRDWDPEDPEDARLGVRGVRYGQAGGADRFARARLVVACDGIFSALRKKLSEPEVRLPGFFVGAVLRDTTLPYGPRGHVVLASPSPVLFYPISDRDARCLIDVPGEHLPSASTGALQAYVRRVVAPQLPEALRAALLRSVEAEELRSMQNRQVGCQPLHPRGAFLLGDAFNMRHPLTGGGMTVALSDVALARDLLADVDLADADATARALERFYVARKPLAGTINVLANALYEVFRDHGHVDVRKEAEKALEQDKEAAARGGGDGGNREGEREPNAVNGTASGNGSSKANGTANGNGATRGANGKCDGAANGAVDGAAGAAGAAGSAAASLSAPSVSAPCAALSSSEAAAFLRRSAELATPSEPPLGTAYDEMRESCFRYLGLGGACSEDPVSLLAGLRPAPWLLVWHFFAVALYSTRRLVFQRCSPKSIALAFAVLAAACRIILPLIAQEGWRALLLPKLAPAVPGSKALSKKTNTNKNKDD